MVFCFAIFLQTLLITMYLPTQMLSAEAQILEAIGVDYIDESKVRTPAVDAHHINKHNYMTLCVWLLQFGGGTDVYS
jgi:hypothetical protein